MSQQPGFHLLQSRRHAMKIIAHQLNLNSQHQLTKESRIKETRVEGFSQPGEAWSAGNLEDARKVSREQHTLYTPAGTLQNETHQYEVIHKRAIDLPANKSVVNATEIPTAEIENDHSVQLDARTQLLLKMVEYFTGKKIRLIEVPGENAVSATTTQGINTTTVDNEAVSASEYGMLYHYSEQYSESEQSQFQAQGSVMTEAGETINIDFSLQLSRQISQHIEIDIAEGAAQLKDPLVISFNDSGIQLSNEKIEFDIDADGKLDHISFLEPDAGFLALDKDHDGVINNGRELFGALSGDGFTDLSQYDQDQNNFIDQNDAIFDQLKIWIRDAEGNNLLKSLQETGVEALYLDATDTPFQIRNSNNELLAVVRKSSIYISDQQQAGLLQQIDLVV